MSEPERVVFLLDIDNTLLDHDSVIADLKEHLGKKLGNEQQERYWKIFEDRRKELGYADYLGALQYYRFKNPRNPHFLEISYYLLDYPFADRLYPGALDVIKHLGQWGPTVILSDGDVIFQPRKVERSGILKAVDGRVLIYIHKEQHTDDLERDFPAEHYVLVDDKLKILTAFKKIWGSRLTTVFPRQGHYANDPKILAEYPSADISIDHIGDLLQFDISTLISASQAKNEKAAADGSKENVNAPLKVLVIDVGGSKVKFICTGQESCRKFKSGPTMPAVEMVAKVRKATEDWKYDVVSIGYPGPVLHGKPVAEPHNLGVGWFGFDFETAFGCPVKVINDAAMQAIGSYKGGKMLFIGLGTGLGTAMIANGIVEPMELGHLPYQKGTYEDYIGKVALQRLGKKKWRLYVDDIVQRLIASLEPEDVVLGGGNVKKLEKLPTGCREGDNANAFQGGFRLWESPSKFTL